MFKENPRKDKINLLLHKTIILQKSSEKFSLGISQHNHLLLRVKLINNFLQRCISLNSFFFFYIFSLFRTKIAKNELFIDSRQFHPLELTINICLWDSRGWQDPLSARNCASFSVFFITAPWVDYDVCYKINENNVRLSESSQGEKSWLHVMSKDWIVGHKTQQDPVWINCPFPLLCVIILRIRHERISWWCSPLRFPVPRHHWKCLGVLVPCLHDLIVTTGQQSCLSAQLIASPSTSPVSPLEGLAQSVRSFLSKQKHKFNVLTSLNETLR